MPSYDHVKLTPQGSAPGSPAQNEVYYKDSDDRLYLCLDGTGGGGGAYDEVKFVPQGSAPTAERGIVYLDSTDDRFKVCTAT